MLPDRDGSCPCGCRLHVHALRRGDGDGESRWEVHGGPGGERWNRKFDGHVCSRHFRAGLPTTGNAEPAELPSIHDPALN